MVEEEEARRLLWDWAAARSGEDEEGLGNAPSAGGAGRAVRLAPTVAAAPEALGRGDLEESAPAAAI
jgi:hypothetical protein